MSRVAKANIQIPANVQVTLNSTELSLKGPKGSLTKKFNSFLFFIKVTESLYGVLTIGQSKINLIWFVKLRKINCK